MRVIVEIEIKNCEECPHLEYKGTICSEDIWMCSKLNKEVQLQDIDKLCPFIESTLKKLYNEKH